MTMPNFGGKRRNGGRTHPAGRGFGGRNFANMFGAGGTTEDNISIDNAAGGLNAAAFLDQQHGNDALTGTEPSGSLDPAFTTQAGGDTRFFTGLDSPLPQQMMDVNTGWWETLTNPNLLVPLAVILWLLK